MKTYINFFLIGLRADECSAYLGYLSKRYYMLSNYTMFVHADIREHVHFEKRGGSNMLEFMIKNILIGG